MTESLGKLGPHEGQELELLLSGHKSIAYFYELLPIEFIKHLEQGSLSMLSKDIETSLPFPFSIMLIYKIGQLLGYSTQDIEFYIQHISNRHLKTKI
ncbi:hemin receptor [Acinetobacter baumannii]